MYPFVNVLIGWLAAAVKGRVSIVASVAVAAVSATILLLAVTSGVFPGRSLEIVAIAPLIGIASEFMHGQADRLMHKSLPGYVPPRKAFERKRILGGGLIYLACTLGTVAVGAATPWFSRSGQIAATFVVLAIGAAVFVVLIVFEHRQRAALQREAKQD